MTRIHTSSTCCTRKRSASSSFAPRNGNVSTPQRHSRYVNQHHNQHQRQQPVSAVLLPSTKSTCVSLPTTHALVCKHNNQPNAFYKLLLHSQRRVEDTPVQRRGGLPVPQLAVRLAALVAQLKPTPYHEPYGTERNVTERNEDTGRVGIEADGDRTDPEKEENKTNQRRVRVVCDVWCQAKTGSFRSSRGGLTKIVCGVLSRSSTHGSRKQTLLTYRSHDHADDDRDDPAEVHG